MLRHFNNQSQVPQGTIQQGATAMATGSNQDIFYQIRQHVSQTLKMAEAQSKITNDTRDLLGQLILTRRGDGQVVLDMGALQRLKATENQWTDRERSQQDRFINPTRLPQMVPGLSGLSPAQYLSFVQRPLELNGDNAPFLEAQTLRLFNQYSQKEQAANRNRLFGHTQRFVAKLLIDELLTQEHGPQNDEQLNALRSAIPAQTQFEMASKALNISTTQVMNRLFKYGIALHLVDSIKAKALQVQKAQPKFENTLRKLANSDTGPTARTRIKEIFLGYQKDQKKMTADINNLGKVMQPILPKLHKETFETEFSNLHRQAAQLDARVSRWVIIMNEAFSQSSRTPVEKIKGMHAVYTS